MLEEIFNLFKTEDQVYYSREYGVYLSTRKQGDYLIYFYSVTNFYVEIWYDQKEATFSKVVSFNSDSCFEPYLEKVEIAF